MLRCLTMNYRSRASTAMAAVQYRCHSGPSSSNPGDNKGGSPPSKKGQIAPASPDMIKKKTPTGKLDNNPELDEDGWPKRRILNPETGEIGGPQGPEPTRYGDWERKGRVSDF